MCGIVYSENFTGLPVNNDILQQYDKQKLRGQQGFGVFDGINNRMVHAAEENRILNWLCKEKNESSLLLMHHRFPTSTINVRQAAHPFSTKKYFGDSEYILVHNGTIRNDDELFVAHQEQGIQYHSLLEDLTFNDSEALLWDFALFMEGKQKEITASGAIAFICLKLEQGRLTKMYFARNSSPLNMLRTKAGLSLSSEGEGESILPNTLHTWNYDLKRLTTKRIFLPSYVYTAPQGGYRPSEYYPYTTTWEQDDDYETYSDTHYGNYGVVKHGQATIWEKFDRNLKKQEQAKVDDTIRYLARQYLTACGGHFESAYWAIEADYETLQDDMDDDYKAGQPQDAEMALELRQLEKVLDYISNDPDYINDDSVSEEYQWLQER